MRHDVVHVARRFARHATCQVERLRPHRVRCILAGAHLARRGELVHLDIAEQGRIATLDGIQPNALHELDEVIEKQFSGNASALKTSVIGGV